MKEIVLPKYYKESFFSTDTLLHPEINGGRYGVAGDPVPYTLRGDNIITLLLLLCFCLCLVSFSRSWRFISQQAKRFFVVPRSESATVSETTSEVHFLLFLVLQTGLLLALLQYFYTQHYVATTFMLSSPYQLIAIFFGVNMAYFIVKALLYQAVNLVFFDARRSMQWLNAQLFITGMEGVALLPLVLLLVYFNLSMQNVIIYFSIILVLAKILTFYKSFLIFFRREAAFVQIFLYFCTLEIVPLITLGGVVVLIGNSLRINY